jgi:hypothetical protein
MMDWRAWAFNRLTGAQPVTDVVGDRIYGMLGEEDTPAQKPFMVLRFNEDVPDVPEGMFSNLVVWVHDDPLGYTRIDQLLKATRDALEGPVPDPDAIQADWIGDSPDLADDRRGTVVRNASFRLAGRR